MARLGIMLWFVVAGALLALNSIICYRNVRRLIDDTAAVAQSREVLGQLDTVLSVMQDAETGQRGYVITGRESYLTPYDDAESSIDREMGRLTAMLTAEPARKPAVAALAGAIGRKRMELARPIAALRTGGGFDEARRIVMDDRGKTAMDDVRRAVADLRAAEASALADRRERGREASRTAVLTLGGAGVLNVLLLGGLGVAVVRDARQRSRAAAEAARQAVLQQDNQRLTDLAAERQQAADALESLNQKLQISNRELQDFASVASHDLQEPLRKIRAFGDRLQVKAGPALADDGRDYLARMLNAAERMQTLISDLLAFSRVTTKAQPFRPVDLNTVAAEVVSDLETRVQQAGGTVAVDPLPTIDADPTQMRQLLQNLIANALKFVKSDVPPAVRVWADVTPAEAAGGAETVELRVADNGIGFDEKYLDRIFNVFQRLHGRGVYEGTGIGLAVCRKIAERHGGSITARSRPDEGATFVVRMPVRQAEL